MPSRLGRITRPSEFRAILKQGRRRTSGGVVMIALPNKDGARLGFALSRGSGNAVHRNRFRRVVREFLRQQSLSNQDLVIMVRAPIAKLENTDLRKAIKALLEEMK